MENLFILFTSLLSGCIGALLTIWSNHCLEKKNRKIVKLHKQLQDLYLPMSYHLSYLNSCIVGAFLIIEGMCIHSDNANDQNKIEASYKLLHNFELKANRLKNDIFEMISNNYALIDIEDSEFINNYLQNSMFYSIEIDKLNHNENLPREVTDLLEKNKQSIYSLNEVISKRIKKLSFDLDKLN